VAVGVLAPSRPALKPRRLAAAPAPPAPTQAPRLRTPAAVLTRPLPKETVDNPYGLSALWAQGDFVARGTLIILVIIEHGSCTS